MAKLVPHVGQGLTLSNEQAGEGVPEVVEADASESGLSGDIAGVQGERPFSMRISFTIVQTADDVAGVWNTSGGTSGTLKARVEGDRLLGFSAKQLNRCDGEFEGGAVIEVNGERLRGSYVVSGCGVAVNASFVVTRQRQ